MCICQCKWTCVESWPLLLFHKSLYWSYFKYLSPFEVWYSSFRDCFAFGNVFPVIVAGV